MSPRNVERLTWVLIYGGLLALGLAYAMPEGATTLAWTIGVAGASAAAVGVVLIWVRSRMRDPAAPGRDPAGGAR